MEEMVRRRRRSGPGIGADIGRSAAAMSCIVGAALASGCHVETREQVFPSPDGYAVVIYKTELGGGAAGYVANSVDIAGPGENNRFPLGSAGRSPRGNIYWTDSSTVNICGFEGSEGATGLGRVIGKDKRWKYYRVTSHCPTLDPAPRKVSPPLAIDGDSVMEGT